MSKINVDTWEPESGTAATLMASGDTVTLPNGAILAVASGGDINVASGGEIDIASGATLDVNGTIDLTGATTTGFPAGGLFSGYAVFQDQKSVNTDAGTFTSGAWRTRDLNTTVFNTDTTNITLGTNQFTLLTGSYLIGWSAPAKGVDLHMTRLFDVTGGVWFQNGTGEFAANSYNVQTISVGYVRVTVDGTNIYSVEHRCDTTRATNGLGDGNNFSAGPEVYTTVIIYKEA
jgi:hypothetical protein